MKYMGTDKLAKLGGLRDWHFSLLLLLLLLLYTLLGLNEIAGASGNACIILVTCLLNRDTMEDFGVHAAVLQGTQGAFAQPVLHCKSSITFSLSVCVCVCVCH